MIRFLKFNVPAGARILEIGCGTGHILNALDPQYGVGIDISAGMINVAAQNYTHLTFHVMDAEDIRLDEKFDYIIISDTVGLFEDVQNVFLQMHKLCHEDTRIIINYINFVWFPALIFAEKIGLKMPVKRNNWLEADDIENLLKISDFDVIRYSRKILFPFNIPGISFLINKYVANLPWINELCLSKFIIARSMQVHLTKPAQTVSVVIPARNEAGNIRAAIQRVPLMGPGTEVIFVEGNSTDNTWDEIQKACNEYSGPLDLKYMKQDGKGKNDAVKKGFKHATGDILMILDADWTVPPEDLTKFYEAVASGKGEYINGTRLVYPMEKEAMRFLNIIGNKFFSIMFTWLLNQRLKDTLCGTKVMTKKNYQSLEENRSYFGDFDPFGDYDLIFGSAKLNLKFVEIPIRYKARTYGETNISRFTHGWLLLKMCAFAMNKIKFI